MEFLKELNDPVKPESIKENDNVHANELNFHEQTQELEVLESIFGADFFQTEPIQGMLSFQVVCKVQLDAGQQVLLEPVLGGESGDKNLDNSPSSSTDEPACPPALFHSLSGTTLPRFPVNSLPPAVLELSLPKDYPSSSPPIFSIRAEWLDECQIKQASEQLLQIWQGYVGSPIVFVWCDFLANSLLEVVTNSQGVIRLSASTEEEVEDKLISILKYNQESEQRLFLEQEHTCGICLTEKSGREFFRLQNCKHHFCTECFESYCSIHVSEGTVQQLQCPDPKCQDSLPPHLIKAVVSEEAFQRWERLSLKKSLDAMSDVTYCPRCQYPTIADSQELAQCPKCFYCFCCQCRSAFHPGEQCVAGGEQGQRILKELNALQSNKNGISDEKHKRISQLEGELQDIKRIFTTCRPCPKCKMFIEKNSGCNKMTCTNCGGYMCWLCGKSISGYEHFESRHCVLWDPGQIKKFDQQMELRARVYLQNGNVDAFFLPGGRVVEQDRLAICPVCKFQNIKTDRNNHIHCYGCRQHFCKLCRQRVIKSSEHYGIQEGKCRQHSD